MTFYEVKIGKIISVFVEVNNQTILAYYEVKDIRKENNERVIYAVLAEETKKLIKADLSNQLEITLDFFKWSDIVHNVSSVNDIFLEHFIKNEDVDGAAKYALTLDKEERKMSLGIKQLIPDPWENIAKKYPVESKHNSKVRNFT